MNNQKEEFRDIPNYEGIYQVSDLGRVKSLPRKYSPNECFLKSTTNENGYLIVSLYEKGYGSKKRVHQLVAVAFLGHVPCGIDLVVNHIDFNRTNNNLNNLEIVTQRENTNQEHLKSSSKYIGVTWREERGFYQSSIRIKKGKIIFLGHFTIEIEASNMYQKALANIEKYNGNNSEFRNYLNSL